MAENRISFQLCLRQSVRLSVTRYRDYFSIFSRLCQGKFAQWHLKFVNLSEQVHEYLAKYKKTDENLPENEIEDIVKAAIFCQIWSHWASACAPKSIGERSLSRHCRQKLIDERIQCERIRLFLKFSEHFLIKSSSIFLTFLAI